MQNTLVKLTGLSILILCACTSNDTSSPAPDLGVHAPFRVEVLEPALESEQWQRYRRNVTKSTPIETGLLNRLLTTRQRLNVVALDEDTRTLRPKTQGILTEFETLAWAYSKATTPEYYVRVGRHLGLQVVDALNARQRTGQVLIPKTGLEEQEYAALVGPFARHARDYGLIPFTEDDITTQCILQSIFMHNWRASIAQRVSPEDHILGVERKCWLRWIVRKPTDVALSQQLSALSELSADPAYPVHFNRGVLLLRAGRRAPAVKAFELSTRDEARHVLEHIRKSMSDD